MALYEASANQSLNRTRYVGASRRIRAPVSFALASRKPLGGEMNTREAIQSMFADMGLATPEERSRYRFDFRRTGIQSSEYSEPSILDNRTEKDEDNNKKEEAINAELG
ncbi:hypothetical protein ABC977_17795 [Thioalkalicoccus limnaeus]|uniref:Uncharacterized protein n=1 Tax=Thioalkalicoccus limnaeus TaxID=120681 RepID=A0ABV4BLS2_9GAMM